MDVMAAAGTVAAIPQQAPDDQTLLRLWLHGRARATAAAYAHDAQAFLAHAGRPIRAVTLGDVQAYADSLSGLAPASQARKLAVVKSLFGFAHRLGFVAFNVAAAIRLPAVRNDLAARIMSEAEVHRLLAVDASPRDAALLFLLYGAGLRVSEAAGLRWRDLQPRDDAGQATVFGKRGKTRAVLLPRTVWRAVVALQGEAGPEAPVFPSSRGGEGLTRTAVHRIVKAAAARAGLPPGVSAHWLRHCHASHALDRGAPVSLVQAGLGHSSISTTGRYLHARPGDGSGRYLGL